MTSRFQNCHCIGSQIGKTWVTSCCKLCGGYCKSRIHLSVSFFDKDQQLVRIFQLLGTWHKSFIGCCWLGSIISQWCIAWFYPQPKLDIVTLAIDFDSTTTTTTDIKYGQRCRKYWSFIGSLNLWECLKVKRWFCSMAFRILRS